MATKKTTKRTTKKTTKRTTLRGYGDTASKTNFRKSNGEVENGGLVKWGLNNVKQYLSKPVTQHDAKLIIDGFIESVADNLANGTKVNITGLGTFQKKKRAYKGGTLPNGASYRAGTTYVLQFKASEAIKKRIK